MWSRRTFTDERHTQPEVVIIAEAKCLPLDPFDLVVQPRDPATAGEIDEVVQDRLLPALHKVRALDACRRAALLRGRYPPGQPGGTRPIGRIVCCGTARGWTRSSTGRPTFISVRLTHSAAPKSAA